MEKVDYLIHGKHIITCEEHNQVLKNHTLVLKNGKIIAITPTASVRNTYAATHEYDYDKHALLPGLVNSHTHITMNIFRGLSDDLALMDWLTNHIWPAEGKWLSKELVYDASLLAIAEMIRGGTTCFNDMYFFPEATAQAAELAGLRAYIGMHIFNIPNGWAKTFDECFTKGLAFYQAYKNHPLITPTIAPHSTYTLLLEQFPKIKDIADQYQLKINIHLQEAYPETQAFIAQHNKTPLQALHDLGMVSPQLLAIHMVHATEEDCAILQQTKANVVHCPESNMKLASGTCPIEKMRQLGVNIALGTDGAVSNNDLDMFGEMRSAAFIGKVSTQEPTAVPAEAALKMATINGAKALSCDHLIGSLAVGKSADFIAMDLEQIETQPLYHPVSQIVYAAGRHQVTDVWVAGKQLMKNRQLLTLDEKALLAKAKEWRNKIK